MPERFWKWYDRAARVDFAGTLIGHVFDWKSWVRTAIFSGLAGGSTMAPLAILNYDWSPATIFLAMLAAAALSAVLGIAVLVLIRAVFSLRKQLVPAAPMLVAESPSTEDEEAKPKSRGLYVEFASVLSMRKTPAHVRTFWLNLVHPDIESISFGLYSQIYSRESDLQMDAAGTTIIECKITNYDAEPMVDIDLPLEIRSQVAIEDRPGNLKGTGDILIRTRSIKIPKIDPGSQNSFVFYIHNLTSYFFSLMPESNASIKRLGHERRETVPVGSDQSRAVTFPPKMA